MSLHLCLVLMASVFWSSESGQVQAYKTIYDGAECKSCIYNSSFDDTTPYAAVCRNQYSDRTSFCCSLDEMKYNRACLQSTLCSWNVTNTTDYDMRFMACPMQRRVCGQDSQHIKLSMNQSKTITIDPYFNEEDSCHYTFSVDDEASEVHWANLKWMQVYAEAFDALDIYIANATHETKIE